jgi:predicted nuclease of predicted toxin-antitoxin system
MKFLVDTNLGRKFTTLLQRFGYDAVFAKDLLPIFKDEEILAWAKNDDRMVITNDKDFGELIFRFGFLSSGVILIRSEKTGSDERFELVKGHLSKAKGKFIVVSKGKIRVRSLKRG